MQAVILCVCPVVHPTWLSGETRMIDSNHRVTWSSENYLRPIHWYCGLSFQYSTSLEHHLNCCEMQFTTGRVFRQLFAHPFPCCLFIWKDNVEEKSFPSKLHYPRIWRKVSQFKTKTKSKTKPPNIQTYSKRTSQSFQALQRWLRAGHGTQSVSGDKHQRMLPGRTDVAKKHWYSQSLAPGTSNIDTSF